MNQRFEHTAESVGANDPAHRSEGMLLQIFLVVREVFPDGSIAGDIVISRSSHLVASGYLELTHEEALLCDVVDQTLVAGRNQR